MSDERTRRWVDVALTAQVRAPLVVTPTLLAIIIATHAGLAWVMLQNHRPWLWALFGERKPQLLARAGALTTAVIHGEPWRLISHQLNHANGLHLLLNGLALLGLGRLAEPLYGGARFLWLFLLCGVGGGLMSTGGSLYLDQPLRTVGASGALFGLMGALLSYGWRHRAVLPPDLMHILRRRLPPLVALNLGIGLAIPSIDNKAHLGGLLTGLVLGLILGDRVVPGQESGLLTRVLMAAVSLGLLGWAGAGVWQGW